MIVDTIGLDGAPKQGYARIGLQIKSGFKEGGVYNINPNNVFGYFDTDSTCLGTTFSLIRYSAISGTIQLSKLDRSQKIVSGTFSCAFQIPNCDTVKVTEGRFDIQYR